MADPNYHHSQRTQFTYEEARSTIGKRASVTFEGRIVGAHEMQAGTCVVMEVDERYGMVGPDGKSSFTVGGDLELFDLMQDSETGS